MPARALLKFSTPRDAAALAAFISLRVLNPEKEHWRRGIEAAVIYTRLHGGLKVPFTYRVPDGREQEADGQGEEQSEGVRERWLTLTRRLPARAVDRRRAPSTRPRSPGSRTRRAAGAAGHGLVAP
ncbi:hypothetical protein GCM10020000_85000 [Streptomyces olivoverticillatus]